MPDPGDRLTEQRRLERRAQARRGRRRRRLVALALVVAGSAGAVLLTTRGTTERTTSRTPVRSAASGRSSPRGRQRGAAPALQARPPDGTGSVRVPVLMYHRVAPAATAAGSPYPDLTVTPETFESELAWMHRAGFHPIRLERVQRALVAGAPLPPRPVVITFDDGYVDDVTTIAPALRRYRWPATFFVITGRIGQAAFLTWPQILRLDREGMDIGSHTVDHVPLPSLDPARRAYEVTESRRVLQEHLGHAVDWFAYPIGPFDAASEEAVRQAGYLLAFTTAPGSTLATQSAMAEPRVRVHGLGASLAEFEGELTAAERGA